MQDKVILTAGGTGGHVFPALATAETIELQNIIPILVTDKRGLRFINSTHNINYKIIDVKSPSGNFLQKILFIPSLLIAIIKSIYLLIKEKPIIIIGFGGYPALPITCAAVICRKKLILHEPNSILGTVNKVFFPFADKITFADKFLAEKYSKYNQRIIFTGNLIRQNIQNLPAKQWCVKDYFTIAIIGGSQGAKIFSSLIPEAIKIIKEQYPQFKIKIIQQVANVDHNRVKEIYESLEVEFELAEFFHNIHHQLNLADLLISRSGASTLAEISYIGLPAILVPYPYSADNHQLHNAISFEKNGGGYCYEQDKTTAKILADKLVYLINNTNLLKEMSENLISQRIDSNKILSEVIENYLN